MMFFTWTKDGLRIGQGNDLGIVQNNDQNFVIIWNVGYCPYAKMRCDDYSYIQQFNVLSFPIGFWDHGISYFTTQMAGKIKNDPFCPKKPPPPMFLEMKILVPKLSALFLLHGRCLCQGRMPWSQRVRHLKCSNVWHVITMKCSGWREKLSSTTLHQVEVETSNHPYSAAFFISFPTVYRLWGYLFSFPKKGGGGAKFAIS